MKAHLGLTLKHKSTGAVRSATIDLTTGNDETEIFNLLTHLAKSAHAFNSPNWRVEHVTTRVTDCPAGFFEKQKGGANGQPNP